jgi:hypothetical protein
MDVLIAIGYHHEVLSAHDAAKPRSILYGGYVVVVVVRCISTLANNRTVSQVASEVRTSDGFPSSRSGSVYQSAVTVQGRSAVGSRILKDTHDYQGVCERGMLVNDQFV